ncbi:MAG: FlgO family outer membrane protein [Candidatus Electrothrix sp. Rat3]|nr:FlgO family outer membrane protein [Candidatus Electrothrix rattekaaiensis]
MNTAVRKQKLFFCCVNCASVLLSLILAASSFAYEKEINALSAAMSEKIAKADRTSVAVVDFTDLEGNVTQLGRFIAEEFSTALAGAGKGFKVVDRTHLNSIIKENKLSATGLIDPETARKLGKIIGVQALITGTLTPFGENVRIAVKVLDTATAEIIDAARGNIAKTQGIEELLGKGIAVAAVQETEKKEAGSTSIKEAQLQSGTSGTFFDDFNTGPKSDWKSISGDWTMANGKYTVTNINSKTTYATLLKGKKWKNFIFTADITPGYTHNPTYYAFVCPREVTPQEKVCFGMAGNVYDFNKFYWVISKDGNNGEPVGRVEIKTSKKQEVRVKIEVMNGVFTAYINDMKASQVYDTTYSYGSISLMQHYKDWDGGDEEFRIAFDNIKITPLAD